MISLIGLLPSNRRVFAWFEECTAYAFECWKGKYRVVFEKGPKRGNELKRCASERQGAVSTQFRDYR